jgi:type II secretion system protein C
MSPGPLPTSLKLRLLATLLSSRTTTVSSPVLSYAVILHEDQGRVFLYREGAILSDQARIFAVNERRVWLTNEGRMEYLDLAEAAPAATAQRRIDAPTREGSAIASGIHRVGEGRYEISREALKEVLSNSQYLASAQIAPLQNDGQPDGFMIHHIRPDSIFHRIGLENGDRIQAINAHAIKSTEDVLQMYVALNQASHLTVSITRQNKLMTHDYTIR